MRVDITMTCETAEATDRSYQQLADALEDSGYFDDLMAQAQVEVENMAAVAGLDTPDVRWQVMIVS